MLGFGDVGGAGYWVVDCLGGNFIDVLVSWFINRFCNGMFMNMLVQRF